MGIQIVSQVAILSNIIHSQTLQEKVIRGSLIALVLSFLGSVFAYLIRILYSRTLAIEDYGLFYSVVSLFLIFTAYMDLGFGYSTVYFLPKYIKQKQFARAWSSFIYSQVISLVTAIVISFFMIISASSLAKNYFRVEGSEILIYIFCIFLIAFTIMNGLIQVFSGMQKETYYSSITASRWFLTFILSLSFFILGFPNIVFFAIAWALGHLITSLFFLALLFYKHSFLTSNKIYWDKQTFKQMFSLAIPSLLETIIASIFMMTTTFFLTFFRGVTEVGVYNIIFPLASIPIVLLTPLNAFLLPLVSHLMEGEKSKLGYLMEKILQVIPLIGIYFSLFIILFPSMLVNLIFGEKWLGRVELSLSILCLGVICLLTNGVLGVIALGIGKVKERLKLAVIMAVITIPISAFFTWKWGIMGVIIITSLIGLIICILFTLMIKSAVSFRIPYFFYIKLLIFSSALYIMVRITKINPHNWIELIILGLIYTIIYIILGYMLKIYDKKLILMILPRKV